MSPTFAIRNPLGTGSRVRKMATLNLSNSGSCVFQMIAAIWRGGITYRHLSGTVPLGAIECGALAFLVMCYPFGRNCLVCDKKRHFPV